MTISDVKGTLELSIASLGILVFSNYLNYFLKIILKK